MKICISAKDAAATAETDPRFGRARAFCFYETETGEYDCIENGPGAPGGAGVQTAQTVIDRGAQVVLTGSVGPNAFRVLRAAGVAVYADVSGTVESAVAAYKGGRLTETAAPTNAGHNPR